MSDGVYAISHTHNDRMQQRLCTYALLDNDHQEAQLIGDVNEPIAITVRICIFAVISGDSTRCYFSMALVFRWNIRNDYMHYKLSSGRYPSSSYSLRRSIYVYMHAGQKNIRTIFLVIKSPLQWVVSYGRLFQGHRSMQEARIFWSVWVFWRPPWGWLLEPITSAAGNLYWTVQYANEQLLRWRIVWAVVVAVVVVIVWYRIVDHVFCSYLACIALLLTTAPSREPPHHLHSREHDVSCEQEKRLGVESQPSIFGLVKSAWFCSSRLNTSSPCCSYPLIIRPQKYPQISSIYLYHRCVDLVTTSCWRCYDVEVAHPAAPVKSILPGVSCDGHTNQAIFGGLLRRGVSDIRITELSMLEPQVHW